MKSCKRGEQMMSNEVGIITVNDDQGDVLAIVIKKEFHQDGIKFVTPDDYSQQIAYMHHQKGHIILPHIHNMVKREILFTKEVLVIKEGKVRCDFYNDNQEYLKSIIISSGDIILLVSGGHGFECLEETIMVEIKQGPYAGENDKTRFSAYSGEIRLEE